MSNPTQPFDSHRRTANFGRQPEELHIPGSSGLNYSNSNRQSMSHEFHAMPDSGANHVPSINIHQPANSQYGGQPNSAGAGGPAVPGALQPGGVNRPPAMSMNTAPSVLPTLPQLSTQFPPPQQQQQQQQPPPPQQPSTPRSGASMPSSHAHSHSRSSPSGFDQGRYRQQAPDSSKYASPPGPGYPPQTPQGPKHSPLGLADIRPPPQDLLGDVLMSPGGGNQYNGADVQVPSNSNYIAPWPIYAVDWCKWPLSGSNGFGGKIALGSYLEDNHNYIQIIDTHWTHPNPDTPDAANGEIKLEYTKTAEATHSYPVTRILWEPPSSQKQTTDLLATSGDHLRLWSLPAAQTMQSSTITRPVSQAMQPAKLSPLALLSNSKSPEHTAPITSLDWNIISPSLIITSSIDTTCTIWDIPTLTAKTQLIAHDKEVFDVRFCANTVDVFVSCGADGSVRMFDLRSLEHSTIIYEPTEKVDKVMSPGNGGSPSHSTSWPPPLLRIAASPHDSHLLATFSQDSNVVRVLDVRQPGQALLELKGHSAALNCVEWSPNRRGVLASGADDSLVLLWDLINQHNAAPVAPSNHPPPPNPNPNNPRAPTTTTDRGPAAAFRCDYEISNISWSPQGGTTGSGHPRDWLGVCGGRGIWGVGL